MKADCDFCRRMDTNSNLLYQNSLVAIFFDIDPISKGHILICPKEHYSDFHEVPADVLSEMMRLAKRYISRLLERTDIKGYSMMLNAMQFNDLGHCHLHVIPRNRTEEFGWTYDESSISEEAFDIPLLKKEFEDVFN